MQNKYKKNSPEQKSGENKSKNVKAIISIAVLSAIIVALSVLIIIDNISDPTVNPPDPTVIPAPEYSNKTIYTEGAFSYVILDDGNAMIVGCSYQRADTPQVLELIIPSTLGGKKVTAIGDSAFIFITWMNVLSVPEGVEYIGKQAFSACGFISVSLPSTLKYINTDAFSICSDIQFAEYNGSADEWKKITLGTGNSDLVRKVRFK